MDPFSIFLAQFWPKNGIFLILGHFERFSFFGSRNYAPIQNLPKLCQNINKLCYSYQKNVRPGLGIAKGFWGQKTDFFYIKILTRRWWIFFFSGHKCIQNWLHKLNISNWGHTGPFRTIEDQIGPNRTKQDQTGPNGTIRHHKVP